MTLCFCSDVAVYHLLSHTMRGCAKVLSWVGTFFIGEVVFEKMKVARDSKKIARVLASIRCLILRDCAF